MQRPTMAVVFRLPADDRWLLLLLSAGRWRGALVAVKVVEHTSGGKADVIEGARESLLAASVSHPNVIPCYKVWGRICRMRVVVPAPATSCCVTGMCSGLHITYALAGLLGNPAQGLCCH